MLTQTQQDWLNDLDITSIEMGTDFLVLSPRDGTGPKVVSHCIMGHATWFCYQILSDSEKDKWTITHYDDGNTNILHANELELPPLYVAPEFVTEMLNLNDNMGHFVSAIYSPVSSDDVCTSLVDLNDSIVENGHQSDGFKIIAEYIRKFESNVFNR